MSFKDNYSVFVVAMVLSFMPSLSKSDVWVLVNDLPGADSSVGRAIIEACRAAGLRTHQVGPKDISRQFLQKIPRQSLLVMTECGVLSIEAAGALDEYITEDGKLVTLGGTLFTRPVKLFSGQWVTKEEVLAEVSKIPNDTILLDFLTTNLKDWTRRTTADFPVPVNIIEDAQKGTCLHMSIEFMGDYELLFSPSFSNSQGRAYEYVSFWAKGGPQTIRMSVAFEEVDGSVWVKEITLSDKWRRYTLAVKDFSLRAPDEFQNSLNVGKDRVLCTSRIARFGFGQIRRPDSSDFSNHEFYISQIGLIEHLRGDPLDWDIQFTHRDMLFPGYHMYTCSDVEQISISSEQEPVMGKRDFDLPTEIKAFHPRVKGVGWDSIRPYRWIPLLEAISPTGQYRGAVAALRFTSDLGQMWASFAIEESSFYLSRETTDFIVLLIQRMREGDFLWEGGSTQFTYFPDQDVCLGASAIISSHRDFSLQLTVTDLTSQKEVWASSTRASLLETSDFKDADVSFQEGRSYRADVSLISDEGHLIDRVEHDFWIWQPDASMGWITARKGDFYLDGQVWRPYGINYMPSSGIAREPDDMYAFNFYFSSCAYDPDVIERDLSRIADLGMNMVCVFIYNRDMESWNLIDFLRRCENHDLRVMLSPRDPMTRRLDFHPERARELVEKNRLSENRTIFLYDIAWEYRFQSGYYDFPDSTQDWSRWVIDRYSSVQMATKAWEYRPKIENGLIVPPTHAQWYQSGKWNKMMSDYADFLNTLLHDRFSVARDYFRKLTPNQLFSFRKQYSGDPTFAWTPVVPYDLKGMADTVDVMMPEAYGRIGPWERVRGGIFTNAYARMASPQLPVFWPEAGYSVWDPITMTSPEKLHEEGAAFYRDFHRMLLESYANGIAFWWYAGGFRTIENSDYGILNPDGTDRLITQVIREYAPKIKKMGTVPEPDVWVRYPQEWRPGGIAGDYEEIKGTFWLNVKAGNYVGLKVKSD